MNPCCSGLPQREWGHWVEEGGTGYLVSDVGEGSGS